MGLFKKTLLSLTSALALSDANSQTVPEVQITSNQNQIELNCSNLTPGAGYGVFSSTNLENIITDQPLAFDTEIYYVNSKNFIPVGHFSFSPKDVSMEGMFYATNSEQKVSFTNDGSGQKFFRIFDMANYLPLPNVISPNNFDIYTNEIPIKVSNKGGSGDVSFVFQPWITGAHDRATVRFLSRTKKGIPLWGDPNNLLHVESLDMRFLNMAPDLTAEPCFPIEMGSGQTTLNITAHNTNIVDSSYVLNIYDITKGYKLDTLEGIISGGLASINYNKTSNGVPVNLNGHTIEMQLNVSGNNYTNTFTSTKSYVPNPKYSYPFFGGQTIVSTHTWPTNKIGQTNSYYWTEMVKPILDNTCFYIQYAADFAQNGTPYTSVPWDYFNLEGSFQLSEENQENEITTLTNQVNYPYRWGYGTIANFIYAGNANGNGLFADEDGYITNALTAKQLGERRNNKVTEDSRILHDGKTHRVIQYSLMGIMPSSQFYTSNIGGRDQWRNAVGIPNVSYANVGSDAWPPNGFTLGDKYFFNYDPEYSMIFADLFNQFYIAGGAYAAQAYNDAAGFAGNFDPIPVFGNPLSLWSQNYLQMPTGFVNSSSASGKTEGKNLVSFAASDLNLDVIKKMSNHGIYQLPSLGSQSIFSETSSRRSSFMNEFNFGEYRFRQVKRNDGFDSVISMTFSPSDIQTNTGELSPIYSPNELNGYLQSKGFISGNLENLTNNLQSLTKDISGTNYNVITSVLNTGDFPIALSTSLYKDSDPSIWSSYGPTYRAVSVGFLEDGKTNYSTVILNGYGLAGSQNELSGRNLRSQKKPLGFKE